LTRHDEDSTKKHPKDLVFDSGKNHYTEGQFAKTGNICTLITLLVRVTSSFVIIFFSMSFDGFVYKHQTTPTPAEAHHDAISSKMACSASKLYLRYTWYECWIIGTRVQLNA
jgi:hypothetical protein